MFNRRAFIVHFALSACGALLSLKKTFGVENPHLGHGHYKTLLKHLSKQLESLFPKAIEELSNADLESILANLENAAMVTARHRALENHVQRYWASTKPNDMEHIKLCPLCYSNTLEMVENTPLRHLLPMHKFAVIFRVDGSWFQLDSFGNAYPQEEHSKLALGAIMFEGDYVLLRYADNKQLAAKPAYKLPN